MNSFSSKNRQGLIEQLNNSTFDLLIIGGGVTGAGIALDAAARGLKVALLEMQDFASGTSGRSTKLIHGGLRYLKQLEFKLVSEVGKEREIIHKIAPHLTRPETMLLPIFKNGSFNKFSVRLGMWVYEWLAGVKREERHRVLTAAQTLESEPLLKKEGLLAGVLYYEYRTDDARLTVEVIKEAVARGVQALNYMRVTGFVYQGNKINGVTVEDMFAKNTYTIYSARVVNAAGPWVDDLDQMDGAGHGKKLKLTKGIHLVVDKSKLPVSQSVYFDTADKRMIFVIPREGKTYIGTTDTFYQGDKIHPQITAEDQAYLLKAVNAYFPRNTLAVSEIESGWAGIRPLINKPGKGPSEISRKDELFEWDSGLITIAGGKLTGYRKMAQRVVDTLTKTGRFSSTAGPLTISECSTDRISLAGRDATGSFHFPEFVIDKTKEGEELGLSKEEASRLIYRYGSNVDKIYGYVRDLKQANYAGELPSWVYAQLLYSVDYELCTTPCDFFIRRTGALYFDISMVRHCKNALIGTMNQLLGWDEALKKKLADELQSALDAL